MAPILLYSVAISNVISYTCVLTFWSQIVCYEKGPFNFSFPPGQMQKKHRNMKRKHGLRLRYMMIMHDYCMSESSCVFSGWPWWELLKMLVCIVYQWCPVAWVEFGWEGRQRYISLFTAMQFCTPVACVTSCGSAGKLSITKSVSRVLYGGTVQHHFTSSQLSPDAPVHQFKSEPLSGQTSP